MVSKTKIFSNNLKQIYLSNKVTLLYLFLMMFICRWNLSTGFWTVCFCHWFGSTAYFYICVGSGACVLLVYHYDSCHVQGKPYFFSNLHAQVDFWQGSLQLSMMVMTINGSGEYLFFLDLRLCVIICCENPLDQCFCHLLFFHVANRPLSLI